jgi:XTP/dITP diphosphohydrolase
MIWDDIRQIVLASNNQGKIKEFRHIFAELNIEIIPQSEFDIPEADEPYFTFVENSLHKARHCSKYTNLPALADDSGLCVSSLHGKPGVMSARYAGIPKSDLNNNQKLVDDLANITNRSAYFYCVLVLIRYYHDPQPLIADGMIHGKIIDIPRGDNGFGYDPHFYLPELNKTVAELNNDTKNNISHRRRATNELINKLKYIRPNILEK